MTYVIGEALAELRKLPDGFAQTCVTSPPYWGLRDYGHAEQIGLESTPDAYVARLVEIFAEVRRVLRDDGTLWLNLGDSYANDAKWGGSSGGKHVSALHGQSGIGRSKRTTGLKPKDLVGIPWRVAFALQADGWWLRSDIIWSKPNPMPESITDRPTKAHEYLFLLSKSERYYYDAAAIAELAVYGGEQLGIGGTKRRTSAMGVAASGNERPGADATIASERNRRTVWTIASQPYSGAHFATMPPDLVTPCILAGSPLGGVVLDPFLGSGTVGMVAEALGRGWRGIELNPAYEPLIRERTRQAGLRFAVSP